MKQVDNRKYTVMRKKSLLLNLFYVIIFLHSIVINTTKIKSLTDLCSQSIAENFIENIDDYTPEEINILSEKLSQTNKSKPIVAKILCKKNKHGESIKNVLLRYAPVCEKKLTVFKKFVPKSKETQKKVYLAEFISDGTKIITGCDDNTMRIWDLHDMLCTRIIKGHQGEVFSVKFGSEKIITALRDTAMIWHINNSKIHSADKKSKIVPVDISTCLYTFKQKKWVNCVQISSDEKKIVTASHKTARIFDIQNGTCIFKLKGHYGFVYCAEFSHDNSKVITASEDNTARIWCVNKGICLFVLNGHDFWVSYAQFSPDDKKALTTSGDKTIRIWNAKNGKYLHILCGHTERVNHAQFSHDGKKIASASNDETIRIWDVKSGKCIHTLDDCASPITFMRFNFDSSKLLATYNKRSIRMWDFALFSEVEKQLTVLSLIQAIILYKLYAQSKKLDKNEKAVFDSLSPSIKSIIKRTRST